MKKLPGEQIDGEADKLKRVGALYQNYDGVRVPRVYDDHTTKNILTMEWMPGDSLLAHQGDKHVAQSYLELLFDQIFIYGACQADPHPGNLLYTEDEDGVGRFSFIDAGLLHNVDELKRADLIKLMIALYVGKSKPMAYALLGPDAENKHGYPQFIKKLDALRNEVFDAGKTPTIDAPGGGTLGSNIPGANKVLEYKDALEFLARAQKLAKDCGFEPIEPDELLLKTLFTAITVAKTLHPEASINFKMVRNVARAVLKDAHSKDYDFLLSTSILAAGDKLGPGAGKAAGKLGELTGKAGDKIGDNKVGRAFDAVGDFIERHADDVNSAADQVGGRLGETLSELAPDKAAEMIDKAKNGALGLLKRRGKKK